jgi:cell division protein FtsA
VLAIDIGAGTTDYVLYRNGAPHTTGVVAVGGGHFTNDISIGLRLTEGQAEKLKLRFGRATVQSRDKNEKVWLDGNFSIGDRQFSRQAIESITSARAWELLEVVKKKLGQFVLPGERAPAAWSSPGEAPSCPRWPSAPRTFLAPVPGSARPPSWVNENLRDPGFHTALGILYYGVSVQSDRAASARRKGGFLHNVARLFAST